MTTSCRGPTSGHVATYAEVLGLVYGPRKDAIDAGEPWTHAHAEVVFIS